MKVRHLRYQPRFDPGTCVLVTSETSRNNGRTGVIETYCHGHYPNICRVRFDDGTSANLFDTSLEPLKEEHK